MIKNPKLFFVYGAAFLVAACSIVYELLLANEIAIAAGNTVVWYSLCIGLYIGFLGIGSLIYAGLKKRDDIEKELLLVELALTFAGALAVLLIKFSHIFSIFALAQGFGAKSFGIMFVCAFLMIALIGFLSGIELPLLMDLAKKTSGKDISNRILGVDYFGSLGGAIAFPLLLVPNFNGIQIGFFVASLNFLAAIGILVFYRIRIFQKTAATAFCLFLGAVFLAGGMFSSKKAEQVFAKKYYYYPQAVRSWETLFSLMEDFPQIDRRQSPYQVIDLVEPVEFGFSDILISAYVDKEKFDAEQEAQLDEKRLYLNGDGQLMSTAERVYHEYFAHVPVQAAQKVPQRVLLLGGGDGMLLREILKYSQVKSVVHVELDKAVVETSKADPTLSKLSADSFSDPRVEPVYGDGYDYLRRNEGKFDAVYIDFPVPKDYNVSKLYSREFYHFAQRAVYGGGFLAIYAPGLAEFEKFDEHGNVVVDQSRTAWKEYYNTLRAAGFSTILPFFSNLERENMAARVLAEELVIEQERRRGIDYSEVDLTEEMVEQARQRRDQEINAMMDVFPVSFQESFIFAQKGQFRGKLSYSDFGAEYAVMNNKRFFSSFRILLDQSEQIEWKYVNSILRPTLPNFSLWTVRLPYYLD